jgi:hypothetical protein
MSGVPESRGPKADALTSWPRVQSPVQFRVEQSISLTMVYIYLLGTAGCVERAKRVDISCEYNVKPVNAKSVNAKPANAK